MKYELVLFDKPLHTNTTYNAVDLYEKVQINIQVDENSNIKEMLSNRNKMIEDIQKDEPELAKQIDDNFNNIMDNIEFISLDFNDISDEEFINNNIKSLNKKIILSEPISINELEKTTLLYNSYKDIIDNIYVLLEGNNEPVNLKRCFDTIIKIEENTDRIKKLGLSPMEAIMYIYDDLKEKIYQEEAIDEDNKTSRDLAEVLFNDKIVCEGYANIFSAMLNKLNIKNSVITINFKNDLFDDKGYKIGHARNCIYVNDPKYGIDGVYYFDVTFDSKQKYDDLVYTYKYKNFARTKEELDELDRDKGLYFENTKRFMDVINIYQDALDKVKEGDFPTIGDTILTVNFMSNIIGKDNLLEITDFIRQKEIDIEKFAKEFGEVVDKFQKPISPETMVILLNNVRKIKYYNGEDTKYSINDLYRTYKISKWNNFNNTDKRFLMLKVIIGNDYDLDKEVFIDIINRNKLHKEVAQTRFTKCLRLCKDKKSCNL